MVVAYRTSRVVLAKTDIFAEPEFHLKATDGHFFKVDSALAKAITDELSNGLMSL